MEPAWTLNPLFGTCDDVLAEPMPSWLRAHWDELVIPLVALAITRQADAERAAIYAALDRAPLEYCVDADRRVVLFGVEGFAFVAIAFEVITGVPSNTISH